MKKYYMAVDGGGSKLISILFDDSLNFVSTGRGGSINGNFASMDEIKKSMLDSITACLPEGFHEPIQCCFITMPGPAELYVQILQSICPVMEMKRLSEGSICLLSGIQKKSGHVALSGTGSGAFIITDIENVSHLGGWGSLIGDEGSGFDIGCKGLQAAIHSYDTRGPKTALEEMIRSYFRAEDFLSVRNILYRTPTYRSVIAKLCLLVLNAADLGDPIAIKIMENAGRDLAKHILAIISRDGLSADKADIVTAGSVWKRNPYMFNVFKQDVLAVHPTAIIHKPLFEPVMGSVVYMAYQLCNEVDQPCVDHLKEQFGQFLIGKG
ncbi:MAG TPA: hypothetical protein DDZ89_08355 [Clostridiales bacterium]|nr:hypothetical protein [Clostridiales bacterium]